MTAKDREGAEIGVGDRVFIDRDRASVLVVGIEPMTSKPGAHWIVVQNSIDETRSCFDISVRRAPEGLEETVTYREWLESLAEAVAAILREVPENGLDREHVLMAARNLEKERAR